MEHALRSARHGSATTPTIHVLLDDHASPAEVEAIRAAFEAAGIATDDIAATYSQKGLWPYVPWIVLVTVGRGLTVQSFFRTYFPGAPGDGWQAVKAWHQAVRKARQLSPLTKEHFAVSDTKAAWLVFSNLPDAAYAKLLELDWDADEPPYFVWDPEGGHWRNDLLDGPKSQP